MTCSDRLHGWIFAPPLAFPVVSGGWRLLVLLAGAAVAVVLFLVLRGEDEPETSPPPTTTEVVLRVDPAPPLPPPPPAPLEILIPVNTDAVIRRTIPRGRQVVLIVSGAAGEEVHLHGYDVLRTIGPSGVVRLPFRATIPGRFEVELEASHRQIADLTVR
jgi:hypothetical protein